MTSKKCFSDIRVKLSGVLPNNVRMLLIAVVFSRFHQIRCNFRKGDARTNEKNATKKTLRILLYVMPKGSFQMTGKTPY
ncbi:MAG: hypothetical protein FWG01_00990 [Betaproteobacteria bacterium]|nr:hypothetical protein [Betaproteobacteria bacterium]